VKPTPEILAYFPGKQAEITSYANLLASVAIERGLVGPKEADRIWERHIANCIPITTIIPQEVRVVDIGSGAGLPGIVIALARPDLKVTLVEPLQRRVDFLLEVVDQLKLPIQVVRGRAEAVKMQFEIITPEQWHRLKN
jgi:Predicted S-adenosylmethionine-dependent methyltransferase involved in bacterial cell division